MTIARGCVKTLSYHGRYGKAGTTASLVLQCLHNAAYPTISRKHGKTQPQSFSHWVSSDHPDLQSPDCNRKTKQTNLQLSGDYRSGWPEETQWENDCGSFLPCFLLVHILGSIC